MIHFSILIFLQGTSGLGFAIVEEVRDNRPGICIRSITPGGVAAQVTSKTNSSQKNVRISEMAVGDMYIYFWIQNGQLSVGDQILEVGDKQLIGVHYEKVSQILKIRKCYQI